VGCYEVFAVFGCGMDCLGTDGTVFKDKRWRDS